MRISILTLFLFFHFGVFGQVSGVVNSYHKVITISSTSTSETITLDNTTGLADFDKVVIIQMKGAVVSTANDNTYGSISSSGLGNAGNYEIATICKVNSNNTVTLVHKLLNTYTTSGKVQLVKIARYETVTVDGQLLAGNWVNSTGKGGVLAVMADELILNAPVSADGKGYSGGRYMITNGGYCFDNRFTRFSYDPTPYTESSFFLSYPNTQAGSYNGESITDPILAQQGG